MHFFRWLFSWKTLRRGLIALIVSVTLIALGVAVENYRGKRAWDQYKTRLEEKGEVWDFQAYIPKAIPESENFAATPLFQNVIRSRGTNEWNPEYNRAASRIPASESRKSHRHVTDIQAWAKAFEHMDSSTGVEEVPQGKLDSTSRSNAAPKVLEGLREVEIDLAELAEASKRPTAQYQITYDLNNPFGTELPHLSSMKALCLRLQLRADAYLALGRTEEALQDVRLSLRLVESLKDEPFLITYLVRVACIQLAVQPIWEGLGEHRWNESQLRQIQEMLQRFDFIRDLDKSLDAERAAGVLGIELIAQNKYRLGDFLNLGSPSNDTSAANAVGFIAPRGWFQFEKVNYCRLFEVALDGSSIDAGRLSPSKIQESNRRFEQELTRNRGFKAVFNHHLFAGILLPAIGRTQNKAAVAQTTVNQAVVACALEQFRLEHGRYPAAVSELPATLPKDVITGEPFKYRLEPSGSFVLYSVGWNEKDDGGTPGETLFDEKKGDWVWQYPSQP